MWAPFQTNIWLWSRYYRLQKCWGSNAENHVQNECRWSIFAFFDTGTEKEKLWYHQWKICLHKLPSIFNVYVGDPWKCSQNMVICFDIWYHSIQMPTHSCEYPAIVKSNEMFDRFTDWSWPLSSERSFNGIKWVVYLIHQPLWYPVCSWFDKMHTARHISIAVTRWNLGWTVRGALRSRLWMDRNYYRGLDKWRAWCSTRAHDNSNAKIWYWRKMFHFVINGNWNI